MDQKTLYLDLNQTFNQLIRNLSTISAGAYNEPAPHSRWSYGQLADHLAISAKGMLDLVNGPVDQRTADPEAKVPLIRDVMLDFSRKYASPKEIVPGNGPFDQEDQITELNSLQKDWLAAARSLDPGATCLLYPIPVIGLVTRREAGCFTLYHFQRHLHQMEVN